MLTISILRKHFRTLELLAHRIHTVIANVELHHPGIGSLFHNHCLPQVRRVQHLPDRRPNLYRKQHLESHIHLCNQLRRPRAGFIVINCNWNYSNLRDWLSLDTASTLNYDSRANLITPALRACSGLVFPHSREATLAWQVNSINT